MRRSTALIAAGLLFIFLVLLSLLGKYQYSRYTKGEILYLFQVKPNVNNSGCKKIDGFPLGFNENSKKQGEQINTINLKGLMVGLRKDSNGNSILVLKTPGLLYPKYFKLDAGDYDWRVFASTGADSKDEVDFSQLVKNCPVVAGVIIFDPKTIKCHLNQKEQKPCDYLQKMSGAHDDNGLISKLYFEKENYGEKLVDKITFFVKQIFYIGPVITLSY